MSVDCVIAMSAGMVVDSFSVSVSLPLPTVLYTTVVVVPVRDNAVLNYMTFMTVHTQQVRTPTDNGDAHVYHCYIAYIGYAYIVYTYIYHNYTVCRGSV